jgi:hypothetical protein
LQDRVTYGVKAAFFYAPIARDTLIFEYFRFLAPTEFLPMLYPGIENEVQIGRVYIAIRQNLFFRQGCKRRYNACFPCSALSAYDNDFFHSIESFVIFFNPEISHCRNLYDPAGAYL